MSDKNKKNNVSDSSRNSASSESPQTGGSSVPGTSAEEEPKENLGRMVREIFESIAIALVLAFLFRTFLAEMFVIPTGSMAPTLFGQHKDVTCPECGAPFQVGVIEGNSVDFAVCPNCDSVMNFKAEMEKGKGNPNYSGDRILVGKYPYYLSSPKRWDVVVFLFPGGGNTNFIKRCVGLPGETVRIFGGNVFIKPPKSEKKLSEDSVNFAGVENVPKTLEETENQHLNAPGAGDEFHIARKTPDKILATMLPVYENDYQSERLRKVNCTPRWHPKNVVKIMNDTMKYTPWQEHDEGREFLFKSESADELRSWLVYENLVLMPEDWRMVEMGQTPALKPRLITDMTAYNTKITAPYNTEGDVIPNVPASHYGRHWVKDLILECTVDVRSLKTGEFCVEMVRAGRQFLCTVNLQTGEVRLEIPARPDYENAEKNVLYDKINENKEESYVCKAQSEMNGTDIYKFRIANVDDQVHVWVDGKVLKFDEPTAYRDLESGPHLPSIPKTEDLSPVQIGARNCEINLSHLRICRDIYYVARGRDDSEMSDFRTESQYGGMTVYTPSAEFYTEPEKWQEEFQKLRSVEFSLDIPGERLYFMLGDNSTNSADCRCWTYPEYTPLRSQYVTEYYVPESMLVGEAYYVYWPHTWKPFLPNFKKFRKIR